MKKDIKALYAEKLHHVKEMFSLNKEEEEIMNQYIDNIIVEFQDVHEKILNKDNFVNLIKVVNTIIEEEITDGQRKT